jgi:hypothetical protein
MDAAAHPRGPGFHPHSTLGPITFDAIGETLTLRKAHSAIDWRE